ADQDAAAVTKNSGRPGEVFREHRAFVENAISVRVFQEADAAQMRGFVAALGIVDHFDNEKAAIFIEGQGDRAGNVWLASGQLQVETLFDFEGINRGPGFDCGETGQIIRADYRFSRERGRGPEQTHQ